MSDYISREAAIEYLTLNMGWNDENGYPVDDWDERRAHIADLVNGIPAANVREVVYCKDCRFWRTNVPYDGWGWCQNYVAGEDGRHEYFFCAVAVREEKE